MHVFRCVLQKDRFAYAYLAKGDAKFEELAIMFAPFVDNVIIVSSDEENMGNGIPGKKFILVDEDVGLVDNNVGKETGTRETDYVLVDADGAHTQEAVMVDQLAIVPYIEPEEAQPFQIIPPLDMIDISSTSTQSSLFNWWEQIGMMPDDEGSTATDTSTANSFAFAVSTAKGTRTGYSRYKYYSPIKPGIHLSSTASNSPFAKLPRK